MNIVSFFAGAGGLDLGFEKAGFNVAWANEYDKEIWETYEKNHPNTILDRRSIVNIDENEVPECDGIIGCLLYTSPSPRDGATSRMPSSA